MELILIVLLVLLLVGGLGGPRLGWWAGAGLVSGLIVILAILLLVWLVFSVAGAGWNAGG